MKMYEVGGYVRDEIMGRKSNDVDFSVVLDDTDLVNEFENPFVAMHAELLKQGFKVFLLTPEHFTIRAQFPRGRTYNDRGHNYGTNVADFVLARKEGKYTDGRRPDSVEIGTLEDDLARRDFTMNAIAKDKSGNYIDPFNGQADINKRIIRAVGDPFERLTEDALRAVRALRFSVVLGFAIEPALAFALQSAEVLHRVEHVISDDRISAELSKMFRYDTVASVLALSKYPALTRAMFAGSVSLDSTMKTKGRGK